ncbi:LLM class flavin-dependent oxidoreductase, partial [Frankia sp. CiP1_Cm_nod1]
MTADRRLKLGALLHGLGSAVAGWRHPDVPADGSVDFELYQQWIRTAEKGRFDLLFITDTLHINANSTPQYLTQFEPIALLGALAAVSSNIGLVGTVSTTYSEPYTIARQLATIDHISGYGPPSRRAVLPSGQYLLSGKYLYLLSGSASTCSA